MSNYTELKKIVIDNDFERIQKYEKFIYELEENRIHELAEIAERVSMVFAIVESSKHRKKIAPEYAKCIIGSSWT